MDLLKWLPALVAAALLSGCPAGQSQAEVSAPSPAPSPRLSPGTYSTERGWGQLLLQARPGSTSQQFHLETESSGAGCSLAGTLGDDLQSVAVDPAPGAAQCLLTMQPTAQGIEVGTRTADACAAYCGSNGGFKGHYLAVSDRCMTDNVAAALRQAAAKTAPYSAAGTASTLEALQASCADTLPLSTIADIRLAIASAQHDAGNNAACQAALSPYAEDAARSDDELADGMSPAAADEYVGLIASVREALKMCGRTANGKENSP
ncbi:hypothetical protein [Stenotrophomonas maltophilia]|uniref:hypothetical protein n=1 Tax=Stenotrophomonas maltophilia TaxID=40324 RepID=UPI0021C7102A|nr:hypothetical protein [Stenotrophomonas maltophilia]MCU1063416.1 hypothetical protein [Stenotrophomonas maltophilia]